MDELVNNLKHCLNYFELPEVSHTEQNMSFVRSSINTWKKDIDKEGKMEIMSLDSKYFLCDEKDMKSIIKWDWTDKKKYVKEKYDCDNFAFSFKAMVDKRFGLNGVGLVIDYSGGHAYNIVVFQDGSVKIFETQSDRWPKAGRGQYKFQNGSVII